MGHSILTLGHYWICRIGQFNVWRYILLDISKYCAHDNWCKFILILRHFWIFQQFEESNFWSVPQNTALLDQYLDRYLIDLLKNRPLHHKLSNINSSADLQCKENIKLIFDLFQTIVFSSPKSGSPTDMKVCQGT